MESKSDQIKKMMIDAIKKHQVKHKLTQGQVADVVGEKQSALSRSMQGDRVSIEKLVGFLEALGYSVEVKIKRKKKEGNV